MVLVVVGADVEDEVEGVVPVLKVVEVEEVVTGAPLEVVVALVVVLVVVVVVAVAGIEVEVLVLVTSVVVKGKGVVAAPVVTQSP